MKQFLYQMYVKILKQEVTIDFKSFGFFPCSFEV